jgi:hypothetical protein
MRAPACRHFCSGPASAQGQVARHGRVPHLDGISIDDDPAAVDLVLLPRQAQVARLHLPAVQVSDLRDSDRLWDLRLDCCLQSASCAQLPASLSGQELCRSRVRREACRSVVLTWRGRHVDPDAEPSDCFACSFEFPAVRAASTTGRYACPKCSQHFCLDCDTFIHDVLAVCPGCQ